MHENHIETSSFSQDWNKHENKEQGKTQHGTPCSKNHKATQNKNNTRATALERAGVGGGGNIFIVDKSSPWVPM